MSMFERKHKIIIMLCNSLDHYLANNVRMWCSLKPNRVYQSLVLIEFASRSKTWWAITLSFTIPQTLSSKRNNLWLLQSDSKKTELINSGWHVLIFNVLHTSTLNSSQHQWNFQTNFVIQKEIEQSKIMSSRTTLWYR